MARAHCAVPVAARRAARFRQRLRARAVHLQSVLTVQNLVEDFLQYLRHERGQSDNTAKTYAALLGKFTAWAAKQNLDDWRQVELKHLMAFLQHERARNKLPAGRTSRAAASTSQNESNPSPQPSPVVREREQNRLSGESVYLEIAALRAFYKFAENEKILPSNPAENLSLPRRWKRLPKALSNAEIKKLLQPEVPETKESLCDQIFISHRRSSVVVIKRPVEKPVAKVKAFVP